MICRHVRTSGHVEGFPYEDRETGRSRGFGLSKCRQEEACSYPTVNGKGSAAR